MRKNWGIDKHYIKRIMYGVIVVVVAGYPVQFTLENFIKRKVVGYV